MIIGLTSSRLRHERAALIGIALTALLAGCGGSASGSPTAPVTPGAPAASVPAPSEAAGLPSSGDNTGAACTIVTQEAVGQAGGFVVAAASGTDSICIFQNADKSQYLSVTLFGNQADMAMMLQIEPGSEHIAGLGDDAFSTGTGLLFVRKGDHGAEFLDPGLAGPTDTASRDALVTLARTALPKL